MGTGSEFGFSCSKLVESSCFHSFHVNFAVSFGKVGFFMLAAQKFIHIRENVDKDLCKSLLSISYDGGFRIIKLQVYFLTKDKKRFHVASPSLL
jgi:hypothetical protein